MRVVAQLELTPAALGDLSDIDETGAPAFGDDAANAYAAGLRRAFDQLEAYPLSAPARPEFGEGIRCKPFRAHRILFTVEDDIVMVVRVLHHAQDVARVLIRD